MNELADDLDQVKRVKSEAENARTAKRNGKREDRTATGKKQEPLGCIRKERRQVVNTTTGQMREPYRAS